jgi:glycosyltransferase involved in cell wall biosynthesis
MIVASQEPFAMPKVSIIIPCYNVERYVAKCIHSLCNQSYRDIEIIAVDDGSSDGTVGVIQELQRADDRIELVLSDHQGPGVARNKGQSHASGDYILFVDADDWVLPEMITRMLERALSTHADITVCDIRYEWEDNTSAPFDVSGQSELTAGSSPVKRLLLGHCAPGNKLLNSAWLKETGLMFPEIRNFEDYLWRARLAASVRVLSAVDEVFYVYLQRQGSLMHTFGEDSQYFPQLNDEVLRLYSEKDLFEFCQRELEYLCLRDLGLHWCHRRLGMPGMLDQVINGVQVIRHWFPDWDKSEYLSSWSMRSRMHVALIMKFPRLAWCLCIPLRRMRTNGRKRNAQRKVVLAGYPPLPGS